ncbi:MAG: mechanosensitive ion channel [Candidatus Peribacteria bacterium]|nr:MAG: mechanosensitive ion channel [Candidatus Peribacteria bacterium]
MIAGILVLTNKEFKLGDIIQIDENEQYFGRIEEITIRYTVIRTFDLRKVVVPNLMLITRPIRTYDSEELVRLDFTLSIHYSTPMPW